MHIEAQEELTGNLSTGIVTLAKEVTKAGPDVGEKAVGYINDSMPSLTAVMT